MKTSQSHPLQVDWIPRAYVGLEGRLGITMAPGRQDPDPRAKDGGWRRDLAADMRSLGSGKIKVRVLVSFLETFEYGLIKTSPVQAMTEARKNSIIYWRYPIVDRLVPDDPSSYLKLIADIAAQLAMGRPVVVHCRAGMGRAPMAAACVLVYLGMKPSEAILVVRRARAMKALQRGNQVKFVMDFPALMEGVQQGD